MTDTTTLLDTLRQHRLLEPKQLDQLADKVQGHNVTPQTLTTKLVERGWLTPYQVNSFRRAAARNWCWARTSCSRARRGRHGQVFKARHRAWTGSWP